MLFCSKCGSGWAYLPFYGPIECVNKDCSSFNQKHFEAMKPEIEKAKEKKEQAQLKFVFSGEDDEDDDNDPMNDYFIPYGVYFSDRED